MNNDCLAVQKLFKDVNSHITSRKDWTTELPISFNSTAEHPKIGNVVFTVLLHKHVIKEVEKNFLEFQVSVNKTAPTKVWLASGEGLDIESYVEKISYDASPICNQLPETYMQILDYPRMSP